jgi:hypothetical protein
MVGYTAVSEVLALFIDICLELKIKSTLPVSIPKYSKF